MNRSGGHVIKIRREQDGLWVQEIFSRMKTEYIRNIRLQKEETDLEPSGKHVVQNVLRLINLRFRENLTCGQIARTVNYSEAQVARLLREETGLSFGELLRDVRIYHAKQQLLLSDSTVPSIAEKTGFASPETFYRAFKQQTGFTPQDYRKHMLKGG